MRSHQSLSSSAASSTATLTIRVPPPTGGFGGPQSAPARTSRFSKRPHVPSGSSAFRNNRNDNAVLRKFKSTAPTAPPVGFYSYEHTFELSSMPIKSTSSAAFRSRGMQPQVPTVEDVSRYPTRTRTSANNEDVNDWERFQIKGRGAIEPTMARYGWASVY